MQRGPGVYRSGVVETLSGEFSAGGDWPDVALAKTLNLDLPRGLEKGLRKVPRLSSFV